MLSKQYTITYVSMDQEHLGSNPFYHAGIVLSEYDESTGRMRAINAWGLYSTPDTSGGVLASIKRMLGVNFRLTGGYGKITTESMAFLDRGVGLEGQTVEISEAQAEQLLATLKQQMMLQADAIEEAEAAIKSRHLNHRALELLFKYRENSVDVEDHEALRNCLREEKIDPQLIELLLTEDLPVFEREGIINQIINQIYVNAAIKSDINPETILQSERQWLAQHAKAHTASRLQAFNYTPFSDANYCKVYALKTMADIGVSQNVIDDLSDKPLLGSAPRLSGAQSPIHMHSEGGFQFLETRYEKADFKRRDKLEREVVDLHRQIEVCHQKKLPPGKALLKKHQEKAQELENFIKNSKPIYAMFQRVWHTSPKEERKLSNQKHLPASVLARPQEAIPDDPRDVSGQLMWTVPPITYYDQSGRRCSFKKILPEDIAKVSRAVNKLGDLRFIFERSATMAKHPQVLAVVIDQIEALLHDVADFRLYEKDQIDHHLDRIERFIVDVDTQLQKGLGALTLKVDNRNSLTVILPKEDVEKVHELNDGHRPLSLGLNLKT